MPDRVFGRWVHPRVKINLRLLWEPFCWLVGHVWHSVEGFGLEAGGWCCDRCSRWRRYAEWDGVPIGNRRFALMRRKGDTTP